MSRRIPAGDMVRRAPRRRIAHSARKTELVFFEKSARGFLSDELKFARELQMYLAFASTVITEAAAV